PPPLRPPPVPYPTLFRSQDPVAGRFGRGNRLKQRLGDKALRNHVRPEAAPGERGGGTGTDDCDAQARQRAGVERPRVKPSFEKRDRKSTRLNSSHVSNSY